MGHNPDLPTPEMVLPHRPPHLWLGGITELEAGVSAGGCWTPAAEHYLGHFEGMPLLPGVKQVESLAQLGAYALMTGNEESTLPIFKSIAEASFERPVRPGETLDLTVQITDRGKRDFKGVGIAEVDGALTCRTIITGELLPQRLAKRLLR